MSRPAVKWNLYNNKDLLGTFIAEYIKMVQPGLVLLYNEIPSQKYPNDNDMIQVAVIALGPGQHIAADI